MSQEYFAHAARLNDRAKAQHKEWVTTLSPEQRKNLQSLGVLDAPDDNHEVGGHAPTQTSDMAESSLCRVDIDFAAQIDGQAGQIADDFDVSYQQAEKILAWHLAEVSGAIRSYDADLLSIVVGGLLSSKNIRIAAAGLAFASQMSVANSLGSQAEYSRKIGVSRTILSKSVKAWKKALRLRTNIWQKSDEACETYSAKAKEKHWRSTKATASALIKLLKLTKK